jgi:hypothetical protein
MPAKVFATPRPGSLKQYLARGPRPHEQALVRAAKVAAEWLALFTEHEVRVEVTTSVDKTGFCFNAVNGPDGPTSKRNRFVNMQHAKQIGLK